MQQKFAHFWACMSRISPPSPAPSTPSPGKMRSYTGVQSVRKPSATSKPSSPPAQSLPSWTLTSPSGCTPMPQPQASELSSLKYKKLIICCASRSLNQAEKATKLECLAIVWAAAKFRPYLMSMSFEVYTDHYALQWLKTMRTGSALLHCWSAALEEYDFTVKHRPGKSQTHVDGLSHLPVDPPTPGRYPPSSSAAGGRGGSQKDRLRTTYCYPPWRPRFVETLP